MTPLNVSVTGSAPTTDTLVSISRSTTVARRITLPSCSWPLVTRTNHAAALGREITSKEPSDFVQPKTFYLYVEGRHRWAGVVHGIAGFFPSIRRFLEALKLFRRRGVPMLTRRDDCGKRMDRTGLRTAARNLMTVQLANARNVSLLLDVATSRLDAPRL
jgi:hypothetical protein